MCIRDRLVPDHVANTDKRLDNKKAAAPVAGDCQKVVVRIHGHNAQVGLRGQTAGSHKSRQLDGQLDGHRHAGYNRKAGLGKP